MTTTKSIGIVPLFHYVPFYASVGLYLEAKYQCEVHFYCFSDRWAESLRKLGVKNEKIDVLSLSSENVRRERIPAASLAGYDSVRPDFYKPLPLELVEADRIWRHRKLTDSIRMLAGVDKSFTRFLNERKISVVFGEVSSAPTGEVAHVCYSNGIRYFQPQVTRHPKGRFGFLEGVSPSELINLGSPNENDRKLALEALEEFRENYSQPEYMRPGSPVLQQDASNLGLFLEKFSLAVQTSKDNPLQRSVSDYFLRRNPLAIKNQWRSYLDARAAWGHQIPAQPFVVFPLQVQPENSTDINAWKYRDQVATATMVANALPAGWTLLVREHPQGAGSRTTEFYERLVSQRNIQIGFPENDLVSLLRSAQGVVATSGTLAMEAAMLGVPVITLIANIYENLPTVRSAVDSPRSLSALVIEHFSGAPGIKNQIEMDLLDQFAQIIASSRPGRVIDTRFIGNADFSDDSEQVAEGIWELLSII